MTQCYCTVPTKQALYALQNHTEGECVYCEEDSKIYSWQENSGWGPIEFENKGITMNLYDLNKTVVNQLTPMTKEDLIDKYDFFTEFLQSTANNVYMLLCKEYSYYTLFAYEGDNPSLDTYEQSVIDLLDEIGVVYSIDLTEDKCAVEIWIKPDEEESALAFYLFPYDAGVVYYG